MSEEIAPHVIRSAASVLREDMVAKLRQRVGLEERSPDFEEHRRFVSSMKQATAFLAPGVSRLNDDVERVLEDAGGGNSRSGQLLAIQGWELLAPPDQALEQLIRIFTRTDVIPLVQQAAVDAMWRLDGVSRPAANRAIRQLGAVMEATPPGTASPSRATVAAGLLAIPGSQHVVGSLLRGSDEKMAQSVLDAMGRYSKVGIARWDGLRDDVAAIQGREPLATRAAALVQAFDSDRQLQTKLKVMESANHIRSRNILRDLTEGEITGNARVPAAAATVARNALKTGNDLLLNLALDALIQAPDHAPAPPGSRRVPTPEALQTFRLVLQSDKSIDNQQLHRLVYGLRLHNGDEARSILRLAEGRPGYQQVAQDVTSQLAFDSPELRDPGRPREAQTLPLDDLHLLLDRSVKYHDSRVVMLDRFRRNAASMGEVGLARLLQTPDPEPFRTGATGQTISQAVVDVLAARGDGDEIGDAVVRRLTAEFLTSESATPSMRAAIAKRFGDEMPEVALKVVTRKSAPDNVRAAALSSLAKGIGVDLYGARPSAAGPEFR